MGLHEILSVLASIGSTDGKLTPDTPAVWVFTPDAGADWLVWEYDPTDGMAFGLCDLGLGFPEIGSVVMTQRNVGYEDRDIVETLRSGSLGLPVEVDKSINTVALGYAHKGTDVPDWLFKLVVG